MNTCLIMCEAFVLYVTLVRLQLFAAVKWWIHNINYPFLSQTGGNTMLITFVLVNRISSLHMEQFHRCTYLILCIPISTQLWQSQACMSYENPIWCSFLTTPLIIASSRSLVKDIETISPPESSVQPLSLIAFSSAYYSTICHCSYACQTICLILDSYMAKHEYFFSVYATSLQPLF